MSTLKIGDRVLFGRTRGEKTLGEVVKVNPSRLKIKQLEARGGHPIGTEWAVPERLCTLAGGAAFAAPAPKPKRSEAEIMGAIRHAYSMLSPENLTCDGELSRSEVRRRAAALNRELDDAFRELGRRVSEDEAFREDRP